MREREVFAPALSHAIDETDEALLGRLKIKQPVWKIRAADPASRVVLDAIFES